MGESVNTPNIVQKLWNYCEEFVECYRPGRRHARDKISLDLFWLRDDSLADTDNLPPPGVIAAAIVEDLEAAGADAVDC
jgi:hypothetical protein